VRNVRSHNHDEGIILKVLFIAVLMALLPLYFEHIPLQGMKRSVRNQFMNLYVKITKDIEVFAKFLENF
jgi:hypothetical protein